MITYLCSNVSIWRLEQGDASGSLAVSQTCGHYCGV
jgi:hypothetical protein